MFLKRKMPEAPDFDGNRKPTFLTCRSNENRRTLYCDRVSIRLISGGRVTYSFQRVLLTSELILHGTVIEQLQVIRVAVERALDVESFEAEAEPFARRRFEEDEAVEVPQAPLWGPQQEPARLHALHAQVQRRGTPLVHENYTDTMARLDAAVKVVGAEGMVGGGWALW